MRLWTLHPKYLDVKGLTGLWREGLLARAVLGGATKGYTNHPQLARFKTHPEPLAAIDVYLQAVLADSRRRGYHFDASKIDEHVHASQIQETNGQLEYEWAHLLKKLEGRDRELWQKLQSLPTAVPHPLFAIIDGAIQPWEKQ